LPRSTSPQIRRRSGPISKSRSLRHAATLDEARPAAVARRRKTAQRTARENVEALCDPGSFVEYGALALPAQRGRRKLDDLIENGAADGWSPASATSTARSVRRTALALLVMAYDYTVLAGTQGAANHRKMDRLLGLAERHGMPIVLFAEGGGGRPGDTDVRGVAHLDVMTFSSWARLSGLVPRIGIVSGRCFAGNAALLGASDVIVATRDATIGMGGPAMIEGGGLGLFAPEEVGPLDSSSERRHRYRGRGRTAKRCVDAAKNTSRTFRDRSPTGRAPIKSCLRVAIPENRLRVYDVRNVVHTLADTDSVLELRPRFGTRHRHRARARRGPAARHHREQPAAPRRRDRCRRRRQSRPLHAALRRVFAADPVLVRYAGHHGRPRLREDCARAPRGAHVRQRRDARRSVLHDRAAQGLRPRRADDGGRKLSRRLLHGLVADRRVRRDGARRRDPPRLPQGTRTHRRRRRTRGGLFERMVAAAYEDGKAINTASYLELDDVIDPADSRRWIRSGLQLTELPFAQKRPERRAFIDTW
jgi:acetyl-CoA carboxylase carboxyltransferase component